MTSAADRASPPDFALLFQTLPDPVAALDRDFVVVAASDTYLAAIGRARADLIGRSVLDLIPNGTTSLASDLAHDLVTSLARVVASGRGERITLARTEAGELAALNLPMIHDDRPTGYVLQRLEVVAAPVSAGAGVAEALELQRANELLQQASAELERLADRARDLDRLRGCLAGAIDRDLAGRSTSGAQLAAASMLSARGPVEMATSAPPAGGTGTGTATKGARPVVLVVEDNIELNLAIRDALGTEFETLSAYDGREGMRLALQSRPTLVLADIALPELGGMELVREFAAHPELAAIPVVALSPRADDVVRIRMLREGAADWLVKPFSPDELRVRVRNLINARLLEASVRRLHGALSRQESDLAESNRHRSAFLLRLGEQLRGPLDRILGCASALAGNPVARATDSADDNEEALDAASNLAVEILRQGERIASLLGAVGEFAELEAGRVELDFGSTDLDLLLADLLDQARHRALDHDVAVVQVAPRALGAVRADRAWLEQALEHLLANAIRFTPPGGQITLHAERVDRLHASHGLPGFDGGRRVPLPPGDCAEFYAISVYDSGVGVEAEDLARLFTPLGPDRVDAPPGAAGPGLGLAIVREIVQLHGGTVAVTSDPGSGSCFTIWLPAHPAADSLAGAPRRRSDITAPLALVVSPAAGADVEPLIAQLESDSFDVQRAAGEDQAFAMIRERHPDLIAVDIAAAALDGWGFLARLRRHSACRTIPIVISTIDADGRAFDCSLGASLILPRPQSGAELAAELRRFGFGPGRAPGTRILVIDHDATALAHVSGDLRQSGYTALRAAGGREGIELTARFMPDLILLTAQMPDVDGFDVVEALRRDPATAQIPIVIVAPERSSRPVPTRSTLVLRRLGRSNGPGAGRFIGEVRRVAPQARFSHA
jgi:DNA-binding response OmpR family regulator